jgi:hypothetical protein
MQIDPIKFKALQNVGWLSILNNLIAITQTYETIIVNLHTKQMTQATNISKIQTKTIFYNGCDYRQPNVVIILFIHALHLWWTVTAFG